MKREDLKPSSHPNAALSTGSGALATAVVWVATTMGLPMDAVAGAAFATLIGGAALVIGRRGFKGIFVAIWRGSGNE